MKVSEIPEISNVLIKIGSSDKVRGDYRIIAIDLLKRLKDFESTVLEARQPIINKYACVDKRGKFVTIDVPHGGTFRKEYTFQAGMRDCFNKEMESILDFDYLIQPIRLFNEKNLSICLSQIEINKLIENLICLGGIN